MTTLYKLTEQHRELQELVESDEMSLEDLRDTFEGIEGEFNSKAVSLVHVANNLKSDTDAIDTEIKRLQERKKIKKNREESVREYLRSNMEASDITKIECPLFSITLAKGRDVVVIDDESAIPSEYRLEYITVKLDKRDLLKDLKSGDITGCHLEKSKTSLRIK